MNKVAHELVTRRIATENLRAGDVPECSYEWLPSIQGREDWSLINFALSFDGYENFDIEDLGDVCNAVRQTYNRNSKILKSFNTAGLRMLLFFEQRRDRWLDENRVSDYVRDLLELIRKRLT